LLDTRLRPAHSSDHPTIRDVSDTALWVAVYRAIESERPDALFKDPFARRMAGERGEGIVATIPFGQTMAWSIIVRTAVMDEIILRCIERGVRSVLNLGAGLDTRAFRLKLPPSLRWLDVDLPAVTAYRQKCLKAEVPSCQHANVAADLSDAADLARTLADASTAAGPLLVLTEGLLVYLTPSQVSSLAAQLRLEAQAQWWVADLISPLLRKTMGTIWHSQLGGAEAPFQFAPQDSRGFFEALGWKEYEFHSTWADSIRLRRTAPLAAMWDGLWKWSGPATQEALRRMSGVALLRPCRRH
jgi:methyltransferase (TIGR00027 family)